MTDLRAVAALIVIAAVVACHRDETDITHPEPTATTTIPIPAYAGSEGADARVVLTDDGLEIDGDIRAGRVRLFVMNSQSRPRHFTISGVTERRLAARTWATLEVNLPPGIYTIRSSTARGEGTVSRTIRVR